MKPTTLGHLMVNEILPEKYRTDQPITKKSMTQMLTEIARDDPKAYVDVVSRLKRVGDELSTWEGVSVGLDDITPNYKERNKILSPAVQAVKGARSQTELESSVMKAQQGLLDHTRKHPGTMTRMALSGARGNIPQLMKTVATPVAVTDNSGRLVPWVVQRSYAEGLSAADYWVTANESRMNTITSSTAVAEPGDLSKIMVNNMYPMIITEKDCGTQNGISLQSDDGQATGRFLARPAGPLKKGEVLTSRNLSLLRDRVPTVYVRSPLTCQASEGVCQKCQGLDEKGKVHTVGVNVGVRAAQSLCLAEGTEVRMADGTVKRIEAIQAGDLVLGSDIKGRVKPVRVVQRYNNGVRRVYRTKFRRGTGKSKNILELQSTLEHRVLTVVTRRHDRNRRPAPEVRPIEKPENARFYAQLGLSYDDTGHDETPEKYALVLGLLLGDGSYTGGATSDGVLFSCYDGTIATAMKEALVPLRCDLTPQSTPGEYRVVGDNKGKATLGESKFGIRNPVRKILVDLGLWGQRSATKTLPDTHRWSNKAVADLIAGLYASDGCVSVTDDGRVTLPFSSTSQELVEGVEYLLRTRFGVYASSINTYHYPDRPRTNPQHKIAVNGWENVSRFAEAITLPGDKGGKLRESLEKWKKTTRQPSPGRCSFVSQEFLGEVPTYDIEVDHPDHLFVLANGLIVHNSEPLTQFALSAKHGTRAIKSGEAKLEGLSGIRQLLEVPQSFFNKATLAEKSGKVTQIRPAPHGGNYITVGGKEHYTSPHLKPLVRVGQSVEAGDALSDGIPKPDEIVKHKGFGPGRTYLVNALHDVYKGQGLNVDKRHLELLARADLNYVKIEDAAPDYPELLRGDTVSYNTYLKAVSKDAKLVPLTMARGKLLGGNVLQYTAGTPVTQSVLNDLQKHSIKEVPINDKAPRVEFLMRPMTRNPLLNPDWMARMSHRYLKEGLLRGAHYGESSDVRGVNPVPAYAYGLDFGAGKDGRY